MRRQSSRGQLSDPDVCNTSRQRHRNNRRHNGANNVCARHNCSGNTEQGRNKQFANLLEELPKNVLSKGSVIEERKKVRDSLPDEELPVAEEADAEQQDNGETRIVNDVYRI